MKHGATSDMRSKEGCLNDAKQKEFAGGIVRKDARIKLPIE